MRKTFVYYFLAIPFVLLTSIKISAQKNFVEGYVISLKGDTLRGQIDYRDWSYNPTSISFTDAAGKKSFSPNDIAGFFVPPKDYYISSHVSLDLASFRTEDLVDHKEQRSVKDTALFLMLLLKGKTSLYYLNDQNSREHFYVSKDDGPSMELLLKKKYIVTSEGNTPNQNYMSTVELFKGQLLVLFNDCPDLKTNINNSTYSKGSIRKLVLKYNECQHSSVDYIKKDEPLKIKFGVLAGIDFTKIYFGKGVSPGDYDLDNLKLKDCYSFFAGVSFHLIFPRERAQWSLVNELICKPYSSSGYTSGYTSDYVSYERWFTFKMTYLKLFTMIRYQYPNWKVQPYAELGFSNGYGLQVNCSEYSIKRYNFSTWENSGPAIDKPRRYQIGGIGGIGVSYWKFGCEVRYEWTQGLSPNQIGGPEKTVYFVVSFLL